MMHCHKIAYQLIFSRRVTSTSKKHAFFYSRVLIQRRFNLAKLDSVASDFYLVVRAAEEFDVAVR
jgi:hypothetical protein